MSFGGELARSLTLNINHRQPCRPLREQAHSHFIHSSCGGELARESGLTLSINHRQPCRPLREQAHSHFVHSPCGSELARESGVTLSINHRQPCRPLREQAHSHFVHSPCGSELARESGLTLSINHRRPCRPLREQAHSHLIHSPCVRTCSRRGRYSRCIFCVCIQLSRTSSLLQLSMSFGGSGPGENTESKTSEAPSSRLLIHQPRQHVVAHDVQRTLCAQVPGVDLQQ
ncbi:hypothetical protein BV323_00888 [Pseudomonas syringae pv. actinidiae]|nr:hypothetical protein BV353_00547 [Pseudomonas syringae pv. actinidiae]OSN96479.1 hypothetical protein BV354_00598 [Pseudomonas syringae pv. actinidiae]OSR43413.1 hypothetical protein BV320_00889 [Pseudomonas syringae pv. actinidiae]OSR57379.1 hypothetical protein BV323_00888 [Pseudomonas syringae pv. actinidiae]